MTPINTYTLRAYRTRRDWLPFMVGILVGLCLALVWSAIPPIPSRFGNATTEAIR